MQKEIVSNPLREFIKSKRPTLGESSVTTYHSILKNLHKKVFDGDMDFEQFNQAEQILEHLKDLPPNKRKTILSALVVVTDNQLFRDVMLTDIKDYTATIATQEKSEAQENNWIESTEIKTLWELLKKDATLIYKKSTLDSNDLQTIQRFIILSLLGGIFIAPRRALDFCDFKILGSTKTEGNYLDKNELVFRTYKTAATYGEQRVTIPTPLKTILNKWIKHNPTPYLLFDSNMNKLTSTKLGQRLNLIFGGRNIGVNSLRHAYLTGKYAEHTETKKAVAQDMKDMGSSPAMLETYVKL